MCGSYFYCQQYRASSCMAVTIAASETGLVAVAVFVSVIEPVAVTAFVSVIEPVAEWLLLFVLV